MTGAAHRTHMRDEIDEIPAMLERQIAGAVDSYWDLGVDLRRAGLHGLATCARGTSDHAATFFKYLVETGAGLPVASLGPSVASVFGATLRMEGFALLSWSQSGGSPDLAALQAAAQAGGARTVAVVNVADSPLARGAQTALPVLAGPERSVAATKSFAGMLLVAATVRAGLLNDPALRAALPSLPALVRAAIAADWSAAAVPLARARSVFCIGRGPGLAIAGEAALKLKETCRLHAEAYSAAEVLHGPIALADTGLAALVFDGGGPEAPSIATAAARLERAGARVFRIGAETGAPLAVPRAGHPTLDPILWIAAFYGLAEALSRSLGHDPDAPPGLSKVTATY